MTICQFHTCMLSMLSFMLIQEMSNSPPHLPHAPIVPTHQLDEHLHHFNATLMALENPEHLMAMEPIEGYPPEYLAQLQQQVLDNSHFKTFIIKISYCAIREWRINQVGVVFQFYENQNVQIMESEMQGRVILYYTMKIGYFRGMCSEILNSTSIVI